MADKPIILNTSADVLRAIKQDAHKTLATIRKRMQPYQGSGNAGVIGYYILEDGIILEFKGGDLYLYDDTHPGKKHVDEMKRRAREEDNLTTYKNEKVKTYRAKLTLQQSVFDSI